MKKNKWKDRKKCFGREKGAISVFLTIVLVPCIILTCLFGDISRVELSKTEAVAAGDLAMYTLLSHFDKDLKEYYGLVASVENIDDFYDITEKYFTGMMNARGISGEGSKLFLGYLESLRGEDISDFLQVEFATPAEVTELDNANMGDNAAILEDSIVEFMKYRGPYQLATKLIARLMNMNVLDDADNAQKDEPIEEARQEYARAEGDMLKEFFYSYMALKRYTNKLAESGLPSLEKYGEMEEEIGKIARDFERITDLITAYYSGTDKIALVDFPLYDLKYYENLLQVSDVGKESTPGGERRYIDNELLKSLLGIRENQPSEIDEKISNVKQAVDEGILGGSDIIDIVDVDPLPIGDLTMNAGNSDVNPAGYCMKVQSGTEAYVNGLGDNGIWLMNQYARLNAALNCEPLPPKEESKKEEDTPTKDLFSGNTEVTPAEGEKDKETEIPAEDPNRLPDDWKKQIEEAIRKIREVHEQYYAKAPVPLGDSNYRASVNGINSQYRYLKMVYRYNKLAQPADSGGGNTVDDVINRNYQFKSELLNDDITIGGFMEKVREKYTEIETVIEEQIKNLETVIYGGNFSYNNPDRSFHASSLDKLKEYVKNYSQKRDDWGTAIDTSGSTSSYAERERRDYNGEPQEPEIEEQRQHPEEARLAKELADLGGEAVDELKERLMNIRSDMKDWLTFIRKFQYGGNQITKLEGQKDVIRCGKTVVPDNITLSLPECIIQGEEYWKSLMSPSVDNLYKAPEAAAGKNGNEPDLDKDPPALYELEKAKFDTRIDEIESRIDENDKKNAEYEEKATQAKEGSEEVKEEYLSGKGGNLTDSHGGKTMGFGAVIRGIVDVIRQILNGNGDELRDKLYVTEYIMDMFSYSSFNNEGQHRIEKDNGNHYTKDQLKGGKYPVIGEDWYKEDVKKIMENQSLTNVPINKAHNQMNLGEVEYILYGDKKIDENLKTSYRNLMVIRLALNTVSGFQNFFFGTNDTAKAIAAIADAIMAATAGVVPEALTKCVLIGVLAVLESANDLERLKAGVPVALYKTTDKQWCYSISKDGLGAGFDPTKDVKDENGFYYGDYMYLFVLMGTLNNSTYSAILLRTGDLIQANMRKMGKEGFQLNRSRVYFTLSGELKVKPLFLDIPIVRNYSAADAEPTLNAPGWCSYKLQLTRGYS